MFYHFLVRTILHDITLKLISMIAENQKADGVVSHCCVCTQWLHTEQ